MKDPIIFAVVGRSNSGKTTLVERLVKHFTEAGMTVCTIKSIRHDFQMDHEGKDSYRHKKAGAVASAVTNGHSYAISADNRDDKSPLDLGREHFSFADLIIIEGYKEGATRKVEVVGDSPEPPLFESGIAGIEVVVSDHPLHTDHPLFKRDDIELIAREVEARFFG